MCENVLQKFEEISVAYRRLMEQDLDLEKEIVMTQV